MITLEKSVFKRLGFAGGTNYTGVIVDNNLIITAHCYETRLDNKSILLRSVPLRFRDSYKERGTDSLYCKGAAILLKN
jgi:hypothetical protein